MDPSSPRVTVLVAVRDAQTYLADAMQSVLSQTLSDFELLVIDDGSIDATPRILEDYRSRDRRVRVLTQPPTGLTGSLNRGIREARGVYLARMDGDDVSRPERLERQATFLDAHAEAAMVCSRALWIDAAGREIAGHWPAEWDATTPEAIARTLPCRNCIAHSSVMLRTRIAREFEYDARAATAQDYELWLRLTASNAAIHKLEEPLVLVRYHSDSVTVASRREPKDIAAKLLFLRSSLRQRRIRAFELKVAACLAVDVARLALWRVRGRGYPAR
jgi:glycosyltransferase involved in cell wall biosynthesis